MLEVWLFGLSGEWGDAFGKRVASLEDGTEDWEVQRATINSSSDSEAEVEHRSICRYQLFQIGPETFAQPSDHFDP